MKKSTHKIATIVLMALLATSCSLFKVSVSTGDPLPREEMQVRVMTRGFYYDMSSEVTSVADSIASLSHDSQIKIRAVRWKLQITRAAVNAAMQSIPEVSLADMWILCQRMDSYFTQSSDSLLFGQYTYLASDAAQHLNSRIKKLAYEVLPSSRYKLMESFVDEYLSKNPTTNEGLTSTNTTLAWLEYLKSNGIQHTYPSGSISEVIADIGDRVGGQTQQITNSVGWSKDIFELQLQQDSTRTGLINQLDSLERNFNRMVLVLEHIPQISEYTMQTIGEQIQQLISSMNTSIALAFNNIDSQREELQLFIDIQRAEMMTEASIVADNAVQKFMDNLPAVIGKVVFWIILLLIVTLGLPFVVGYWIGGLRARNKQNKNQTP